MGHVTARAPGRANDEAEAEEEEEEEAAVVKKSKSDHT